MAAQAVLLSHIDRKQVTVMKPNKILPTNTHTDNCDHSDNQSADFNYHIRSVICPKSAEPKPIFSGSDLN